MIYMHIHTYVKTLTKKMIQTDEKKQLNTLTLLDDIKFLFLLFSYYLKVL